MGLIVFKVLCNARLYAHCAKGMESAANARRHRVETETANDFMMYYLHSASSVCDSSHANKEVSCNDKIGRMVLILPEMLIQDLFS